MGDPERTDPYTELRALPLGTSVEILHADGHLTRGTTVPPHEFSGERVVPLKLASGYNVGLHVLPTDRVTVLSAPNSRENGPPPPPSPDPSAGARGEGWVALLTTGGTIASRVDYKTGGVRPVQTEAEILDFYPDLQKEGPVRVVPVFERLSEEIGPTDWEALAARTVEVFAQHAQGVVIAHGTDTLGYTAAALAFLLEDLPGPVVLVGAQRSPDRPSSDGPSNLAAAVQIARHPRLAEVVVVMHAGLSDNEFAIHRGTRVRKMHSSRRDAFQSRNGPPLGRLRDGTLTFQGPYRERSAGPAKSPTPLEKRAAILWFFPGLEPARAQAALDGMRGVVLAGSGLGHVSSAHFPWIREAVGRGVVVAMTTQCLEGSVDPYVYSTGRELERAGVLYLDDLLPETAYAKLLWALGRAKDPATVRTLLRENRAFEFEPRHVVERPS